MPFHIFNTDEVAQYLNQPRADIERLVQSRDIPFEKRGDHVVFRQRDIDEWASQRILGFNASRLAEYTANRRSARARRCNAKRSCPG
jgi:excisionase family DNA binding protein